MIYLMLNTKQYNKIIKYIFSSIFKLNILFMVKFKIKNNKCNIILQTNFFFVHFLI